MSSSPTFLAQSLRSLESALARGAALRQREAQAGDAARLRNDHIEHLHVLAEAIAWSRPELFAMHVGWLRDALTGRDLSTAPLTASLAALREELQESLPEDAAALATRIVAGGQDVLATAPQSIPCRLPTDPTFGPLANRYLLAVLEGRGREAADLVLAAADSGLSVDDLLREVVGKTQAEVGRMWQVGELHAGEEHIASRVAERTVTLLHHRSPRRDANGHRVIVASVGGNDHDLGARLIADHFERAGWSANLLGANTPQSGLIGAVTDFRPHCVALSATLSLHISRTAEHIAAVRSAAVDTQPKILVGGLVFAALPDLWRQVGADGTATDAASGVRLAESWFSIES
ncbi:MAG: B12-binding domain-containing protein [Planctomycetota bacterium]